MDNYVQMGHIMDVFRPTHVISNLITFFEMLNLIDNGQFQAAMVVYLFLNDVLPAFIV